MVCRRLTSSASFDVSRISGDQLTPANPELTIILTKSAWLYISEYKAEVLGAAKRWEALTSKSERILFFLYRSSIVRWYNKPYSCRICTPSAPEGKVAMSGKLHSRSALL